MCGRTSQLPSRAPAFDQARGTTRPRTAGGSGAHFTAILEGQPVGDCECIPDLTEGGALPALRGWGELTEMEVVEQWRNRGIGTWLIQHAVAWLRLGGCD